MGEDSHVVLVKKFSGEKGSVRRCVVVMQLTVILAKVRREFFAHFHAVAVKTSLKLNF
jgi:hypothetical protein